MVLKVKFELNPFPREIETISSFLISKGVMSKYIYNCYPRIKKYVDFKLGRKEFIENVSKFLLPLRKKMLKEMNNKIKSCQTEWDKVNNDYSKVLSKVLECKWPRDKVVCGRISLNPVCPRFLKYWSFNIYFRKSSEGVIETTAHEICHFLYFKKWKEVFHDFDENTFETPHLVWNLSEILAGIILNDYRIKKVLNVEAKSYAWFYKVNIGKVSIYDYFNKLYLKHVEDGTSFEDFLKVAYNRARLYEKIIVNAENDFKI